MPSKKRPKQVESWQKWLLSIFLLCLFQGWLLSLASVLLGLVFAILTLPAIVIISISQDGRSLQRIFSKPILTSWSVAIAWTIAGSISDFWLGIVNGQVALAVAVTMFMASAIAWAWTIAAIEISEKVFNNYGWIEKFIILATASWLGLALGWAIQVWLSFSANTTDMA
jgi:hypothetical protein